MSDARTRSSASLPAQPDERRSRSSASLAAQSDQRRSRSSASLAAQSDQRRSRSSSSLAVPSERRNRSSASLVAPPPSAGEGVWKVALYALPIATVLLLVCAWFSESILGFFAHRPGAADIAGVWAFDHAAFDSRAERTVAGVPDQHGARDKYRAALQARSAPFRDVVYAFRKDGYTVRSAQGERDTQATYEAASPDTVIVQPQGGDPFRVRVDERGKRLSIVFPDGEIPLSGAE